MITEILFATKACGLAKGEVDVLGTDIWSTRGGPVLPESCT